MVALTAVCKYYGDGCFFQVIQATVVHSPAQGQTIRRIKGCILCGKDVFPWLPTGYRRMWVQT